MKISAIFLVIVMASQVAGCKSCKREAEPETTIASTPIILEAKEEPAVPQKGKRPGIRRIEIGPSGRQEEAPYEVAEEEPAYKMPEPRLPPDTFEETDLTTRLRDKMLDAYAGREEEIPDVKIYTSEMKYDEFVRYYQKLGYRVQTVAVPAMQVIEPVLEQRPELAGKINLADYEDVVIHQVMIDDAGISAADKYIDPDTFEVVERTFVTKMAR